MAESMNTLHAIYGGTFDPIHYGHLRAVSALAKQVGLQQVTIMPNNIPPHRPQPEASSEQRSAMIELAIAGNPLFSLDKRELQRATPSYTVETLEQIRSEQADSQPLAFIIGQDSLSDLHHWHRWEDLLGLCHLLVCARPGYTLAVDSPQQAWLDKHLTTSIAQLHQQAAGKIYLAHTPLNDISSTAIRYRIKHQLLCEGLLPPAVLEFIHQNHLYC